MVGNTLQ